MTGSDDWYATIFFTTDWNPYTIRKILSVSDVNIGARSACKNCHSFAANSRLFLHSSEILVSSKGDGVNQVIVALFLISQHYLTSLCRNFHVANLVHFYALKLSVRPMQGCNCDRIFPPSISPSAAKPRGTARGFLSKAVKLDKTLLQRLHRLYTSI